ncbi:MAG: DUF6036 family nucleotidyltransferase [Verrucomicrobiota bacterium]
MNKLTILDALKRLGELAQAEGIRLEVSIYGGAAFLLAYNSREATKDIDAILKPREEGEKLVAQVARELELPEDWLNSNVAQFVSPKVEAKRRLAEVEEATGLIVQVPTAEYLLAMKALACRRPIGNYKGDIEDLQFLIRKMKIRSLDTIQAAIDRFFPDDLIRQSDQGLLQNLIDESI